MIYCERESGIELVEIVRVVPPSVSEGSPTYRKLRASRFIVRCSTDGSELAVFSHQLHADGGHHELAAAAQLLGEELEEE